MKLTSKASKALLALILGLSIQSAIAQTPVLVDRQTGKYLGTLGGNRYDADSTSNPYGQYGSRYSADSVNNPYGQYGSRYSNDSPNNPYATNAPAVVAPGGAGIPGIPGIGGW
jgi:hypothetical protein